MSVKRNHSSIEAFFLLVRAGLFGCTDGAEKLRPEDVRWKQVYRLAKEQFVMGLVAEGIERLQGGDAMTDDLPLVPKKMSLLLVKKTLSMERSNAGMNQFIAKLTGRLHSEGIEALLLKGQGVAQCYEKPSWRSCGDVDLLLSEDNYRKAKDFLTPRASYVEEEIKYKKHLGMDMEGWTVELHGSLKCGFSARVDRELDRIYEETFRNGNTTTWMNGDVPVLMLGEVGNVLFVFTHMLNHFYKGGVVVRQVCDWCRLLWSFRDTLNREELESRLKAMGLMSEWRAFGACAVEYLGMPKEAMPFYAADEKWKRKACRILRFLLKSGKAGYKKNKDTEKASFLRRKLKSSIQRSCDLAHHLKIFPLDTVLFVPSLFINGWRHK